MKFHKFCLVLASAGILAVAPGCKDFFDVNVNPLNPTKVGLYSLLPVTQVSMAEGLGDNVSGLSQYTMALMQQLYNTRSIGNFQQTGDSFSGPWATLYRVTLVNNEQIIKQGTSEGRWDYVGIAQLQKAYVYSQMVDLWGDIPYSEALLAPDNTSPRFDKDEDIYNGNGSIQGLFSLIDEGLNNLTKASTPTKPFLSQVDLIYFGDLGKWDRFGRTLKLKLYNQIRKTKTNAEVQALVGPLLSGNLLGEGDDFQLKYTNIVTPDNRNPGYVNDYTANPENRIGRYFYEGMLRLNDPRMPYYFYNQIARGSTTTNQDYVNGNFVTVRPGTTSPFASSASTATVQTVQGLYPVGGKYDTGTGGAVSSTSAKAEAPQRLLTFYSRKYTEAELRLTVYNNAAAARTALADALAASFTKVNVIATADGSPTIPAANITTYINAALGRYDAATTDDAKLEVIMYEKYVASYGYGVDIYTDFRRTGHPFIRVSSQAANASPNTGLLPDDGNTQSIGFFPLRLYYPTNDLTLNPNSPRSQRNPTDPIFWDR
ncbi:SusD/RagB family nutrient-binding outer membrane lipoprotein [Hymenobacter negativus]|uniref:SusD/RagB family nutrient-binding outer membrane lipoprotein n=1 Tax=Hymenobacter negativus TaxID=2795026 RepID=A0ABS3QLJ7_9BACT|nr:SusD/RagB family nutrient-binding outer membrane lipoprotein [Hymenobacter negativus]MBO2011545.1 SusD/RagB family nutrient-binding outer membrane lipoprotein [Hymenobacter negativus]